LFSFPFRSLFSSLCFTVYVPADLSSLSLHDALPIFACFARCSWAISFFSCALRLRSCCRRRFRFSHQLLKLPRSQYMPEGSIARSEEHTSELQSRFDLVCRLLLENIKCAHKAICSLN